MNNFERIVSSQIEKEELRSHKFYSPNLCHDKYVGDIVSCDSGFKFVGDKFKYQNISKVHLPSLIVVLESPHKNEYDKEKNEIGPANGRTGENIINIMHYATREIQVKVGTKFNLVLMNAIQHQCSLGSAGKSLHKDHIFDSCWKDKNIGKVNFIKRLNDFIKNQPIKPLIINCCTKSADENKPKGHDEFKRKEKVSEAIRETVGLQIFYELSHPSAWRNFGFRLAE